MLVFFWRRAPDLSDGQTRPQTGKNEVRIGLRRATLFSAAIRGRSTRMAGDGVVWAGRCRGRPERAKNAERSAERTFVRRYLKTVWLFVLTACLLAWSSALD